MSLISKIKDNNQQSEGRKLYTGVCNFVINALNPDLDGLKAIGINAQNDPSYTGEKEGKSTLRLDFFLNNPVAKVTLADGSFATEAISTKFTIWLEDNEVVNKAGDKKQYINNYGQTTWVADVSTLPDWFRKDGVRVCHKGEEDLIKFLYKWLGLTQPFKDKEGDACFLTTEWSKLIAGNIKELTELVAPAAANGIKVLLGVKESEKDGKTNHYQDVYTKYIMKPKASTDGLVKSLNDEYGQFKSHYTDDLILRLYTPGAVVPDMEKEFASKDAAMTAAPVGDELPF